MPRQRASGAAQSSLRPPQNSSFDARRRPRLAGFSNGEPCAQAHAKPCRFQAPRQPGARFKRRFLRDPVKPRIVTVAYTQSNATVFVPQGFEPTPEILAKIAQNPQRYGSWFYFPKAKACRFKDGELIVLDSEGRPPRV